ncbi:response regulator [bacterium]|nr:response regulator [bacterium]
MPSKADRHGKVLVVDDDEDILVAARLLLKQHISVVHTERDPNKIPSRMKSEGYDVILLDMNFTEDTTTGREGFLWLERILEIDPTVIVILITAFGDVEMAVKAIKLGAMDFITKPWQNEKLLATVNAALALHAGRHEANRLRDISEALAEGLDRSFRDMIGRSPAMLRVFETIEKVAATDANVLILGENGTGKELVARAIHRRSPRAEEAFITVDMGALTDTLFESELFGYEKGAFTDAKRDKPGRFEVADHGTLFLDEIGNVPPFQQSKLLKVLEQREVVRLGSTRAREIDIRLICATNRDLHEMVAEGSFRQDLMYRINTVEIHLPTLRERDDDILLLAHHYLEVYARKYNRGEMSFRSDTETKLKRYHWPGNVRELQHAIERAVILTDSQVLAPEDFLLAPPRGEEADDLLEMDNYNLEEVERRVIEKALRRHEGNIKRAADELGLTRTSLYRRLEKHGL